MQEFLAAYDAALTTWTGAEPQDVPTPYGTTRVTAVGPAGAPVTVLLHGGGATSLCWMTTAGPLARTRRVLAVDVIGDVGRSVPGGTAIRDADGYAAWLDGVLDGLAVDDVELVGHSYGGWLALTYAMRRPDRVRRLVLVAPSQCFAGMRVTYLLHALPALVRPTSMRNRRFLVWEAQGRPLPDRWLELTGLGATMPTSPLVRPRRPPSDALARLDVPTLVVLPEHDRSHDNAKVAAGARALRDVHVVTLPGATHHSTPLAEGETLARILERM